MWQLVLVCRAHALTTAQCHKNVLLSYYHAYFSTSSFLIIMHILALKSILLFIVLESKETKRIKYVRYLAYATAHGPRIQATDRGHTYYATRYNQHIVY